MTALIFLHVYAHILHELTLTKKLEIELNIGKRMIENNDTMTGFESIVITSIDELNGMCTMTSQDIFFT